MVTVVSAARTITEVTLNGASSVNVASEESITAAVTVHVDHNSDWNWHSTKYKIGTADAICVDTYNHNNAGTFTESFVINVSLTNGNYDFTVWIYSNNQCTSRESNEYVLSNPNGIHVVSTYYLDSDSDGYGDAASSVQSVSVPEGYVEDSTDCDDSSAAVNPDAEEACNAIDDNCNGETDEGLFRDDENLLGLCFENIEFCVEGVWIDSEDNYVPDEESCDNQDNDCNGEIDDGLFRADGNLFGLCSANTEVCSAGEWADSEGNYIPREEACDGLDNDCNGDIDEEYNVGSSCFSNPNSCEDTNSGEYVCSADGLSSECNAEIPNERENWDQECASEENECGEIGQGFYVCSEEGVTCNAEIPIAVDSDSDGTADCNDLCASDPLKIAEGVCGCGVADTDTDGDTIADCNDNCADIANMGQEDSDEDGIGDACEDEDNDGIIDTGDNIFGRVSNISTNAPNLTFKVNDEERNDFDAVGNALFLSGSKPLVEFEYDFANNILDLSRINITSNSGEGAGFIIIKGINLSSQNKTKTAYIERIAGTNTLCIIDDEVDAIIVEADCANGVKLSCEGSNGPYTCSLAENNTMYKVSGLKHSAVAEYSYAPPAAPQKEEIMGSTSGILKAVRHPPAPETPKETAPEKTIEEPPETTSYATSPFSEPEEAPTRIEAARLRLGQMTGRVVSSIRESPGQWGGAVGLLIALVLIIAIYIPTRRVFKQP